jgi:hypothetical protein
MWDLWWRKWHWDSFSSEFFDFILSISFHRGYTYSYITWGMNKGLLAAAIERISHPIDTNNNK